MYLCGAQDQTGPGMLRVYIPPLDASRKGLATFFRGVKSFEFKRFKTISQGVARRIVGPRTADRPRTILSLFLVLPGSRLPPCLVPFRFFSSLSPFPIVTYCELLREPRRPAERRLGASLSTRKISVDMTNGRRRTTRSQCASSRLDTCC